MIVLGTLTLPYDIDVIDSGTFANVKGLKKIIIPYTVKEIRANAFSYNNDIEEVVFQTNEETGEGCIKIGNNAFESCENIKNVILPESLISIGTAVFENCKNIDSVNIPSKITTIPTWTFQNSGLKTITLGDKVTNVESSSFYGCKIEKIIFPNSVNNIGYNSFKVCSNLKKVEIKGTNVKLDPTSFWGDPIEEIRLNENGNLKWDSENVSIVDNNLNQVVFVSSNYMSSNDTYSIPEGVTSFSYPLSGKINKLMVSSTCTSLDPYTFPNLINITVQEGNTYFIVNEEADLLYNIDKALVYCFSTSSEISIPSGIEIINGCAFNCKTISKLTLGNDVKDIRGSALRDIFGLREVIIGPKVISIVPNFVDGLWGYDLKVDSNNMKYLSNNNILYEKVNDGKSLKLYKVCYKPTEATICTIDISEKINDLSVTVLGQGAFTGQNTITEIEIPSSIVTIESGAFSGCSSLKKILIPSSVKSIGSNVFWACPNLDSINLACSKGAISGSPWGATKGERVVKWNSI